MADAQPAGDGCFGVPSSFLALVEALSQWPLQAAQTGLAPKPRAVPYCVLMASLIWLTWAESNGSRTSSRPNRSAIMLPLELRRLAPKMLQAALTTPLNATPGSMSVR